MGIPDPPVRDDDAYYETRCVLRARFAEGFTVLISHFGLAKAEARNAVETVLSLLREEKGPVVLMGDFNLEPDSPILAPLFEELTDTAALFPCPLKSWPSDEPEQKIDYIFVKNAQALEADILRYLQQNLPKYMFPNLFQHMERLPENSHGKIDRRRLEQEYREQKQ